MTNWGIAVVIQSPYTPLENPTEIVFLKGLWGDAMKLTRSVGPFSVFGILASVLLFTLLGCDSPPEFLTKSDQESLAKLRSGKYTLISNQELSSMKQEVDAVKNGGRYHIFRGGAHTWRLDTDTGQVCLLMAPADDWIKPEMKAQSCASSDASRSGTK